MFQIISDLEKAKLNWTARSMYQMYQMGNLTYENEVQRGVVWKNDAKSLFIHTLIVNGFVDDIYVAKCSDVYDVIDGKNRSFTIFDFFEDKFVLEEIPSIKIRKEDGTDDYIDINGKKYSELPEDIQEAIKGYSFDVSVAVEPTEDQVCDMFYRLNNGKPLTAMTLSRVKSNARKALIEIGKHELFQRILSQKSIEGYENELLVVKSLMMIRKESPDFSRRIINAYIRELKITEEDKVELNNIYNRIIAVHDLIPSKRIARRIFVKTHLISIIPWIAKSIQDQWDDEKVAEWLMYFYDSSDGLTSISEIYNSTLKGGTGKKESIADRHIALENSYKQFMYKE